MNISPMMHICRLINITNAKLFPGGKPTCRISSLISQAFDSLHSCIGHVYKQKIRIQASSDFSIPESAFELACICYEACYPQAGRHFTEDSLIECARDLIRKGAEISQKCFSSNMLTWLRIHCADELRARADVSKKGLELIDFETMLPPGWQPPKWLPPGEDLEISHEEVGAGSSATFIDPRLCLLFVRERFRPMGEYINNHPSFNKSLLAASLLTAALWCRFNLNTPATLATQAVFALPFLAARLAPLNQKDMQRLHAKALRNPLYKALWERTNADSPVALRFAPLSSFWHSTSGALACYDSKKGISIYRGLQERMAFECLIFETANAFQHKCVIAIGEKKDKGEIDSEEFARVMEYVEWKTTKLYHRIITFGREHFGWQENKYTAEDNPSFIESWEQSNNRSLRLNALNSHADNYRLAWQDWEFLYYLRHPDMAPPDKEWINKVRKRNNIDYNPLELLAGNPFIASQWEIDPFIQLLDKGAIISRDVIPIICMAASDPSRSPEETPIHVARVNKLLQQGACIPDFLSAKAKAWLRSIQLKPPSLANPSQF